MIESIGLIVLLVDPTPKLAADAARRDIELFRRALDEVHPGTTRYLPEERLDAMCTALEARSESGISSAALYLEVARIAGAIRCGHTRVEDPPDVIAYRAANPTHLPFAFRLLEGRMIVTRVDSRIDELERGDEVLAIGGEPIERLVERIGACLPLDGFTDQARASRLDTPYEWSDCGLDHFLPYVNGFASSFDLVVKRAGSPRQEIEIPAIDAAESKELRPQAPTDFAAGVALRDLDATTALLSVATFVNYRNPVAPDAVFEPIFRDLTEHGIEHLIVDLRGNGGGSDDAAWSLARFLASEPFAPAARPPRVKRIRFGDLVLHLRTWVENAFERPESEFRKLADGWFELAERESIVLEPHPLAFQGRITVLIGPFNASGTTMMLAVLREHANLRLVGEPTAGSAEGPTAGLIFFLTLPESRIEINVPVFSQRTGAVRIAPGRGVDPDLVVAETIADLLADRDAALEAARRDE